MNAPGVGGDGKVNFAINASRIRDANTATVTAIHGSAFAKQIGAASSAIKVRTNSKENVDFLREM